MRTEETLSRSSINERALFFGTPHTLGQTQFLQEVQATPLCKGFGSANGNSGPSSDVTMTQTATYTRRSLRGEPPLDCRQGVYATLNIQGSCNNLCDDYPDSIEYAARNAADIAWMQGTFQTAQDQDCVAVMFISQADPALDDTDGTGRAHAQPQNSGPG